MSHALGNEMESTFSLQDNTYQQSSRSERVETWVKHTQEIHHRNIGENCEIGKSKRSDDNDHNDDDDDVDYLIGSDRDEEDSDIYCKDLLVWKKRPSEPKKKYYMWNKMLLLLKCEWFGCTHEDSSVENFVKHVSYHIPDVEVKTDDEDNDVLSCLWDSCGFECANDKEFVRHVNFHAYHTKLKCLGQKMVDLLNMPKCTLGTDARNMLPVLPVEFSCDWNGCSRAFNNTQMFLFHVQSHLTCCSQPEKKKKKNQNRIIPCGWLGCLSKFSEMYKLNEHVKSHTQEKLCACPICGGMFSCATKLRDHCISQTISQLKYRCTSCFKCYASERLLRDHMRRHVNRYKCSFCDMTCPSPSNLSLHIRFRHLNSKPFKCYYCKFAAKTRQTLDVHLKIHDDEPEFKCSVDECKFACRTVGTLNKHMHAVHYGGLKPMYCCHVCDKRFFTGANLTTHLFQVHKFQWTPGHSRFTYTRNEDGFYRLKPFRLETIEVTQEILQAEIDEHSASLSEVCGSQYTMHPLTPTHINGFLSNDIQRYTTGKTVLISIDELDQTGGVVRRKIMETDEVPVQTKGGAVVWNYSDGDGANPQNIVGSVGKLIKLV